EVEATDTLLLFAGLAGRLVEIPGAYRAAAHSLLSNPNRVDGLQQMTLSKIFREQGVLVPETFDELEYFRERHAQSKYMPSQTLGLTICPTLNCNFRCTYCYQQHATGVMTEKIQDEIVSYIENSHSKVKKLHVTWFGGEPLLGLQVIEQLSRRLLAMPVEYNASIITNGSLLYPKTARKLLDLKVGWGQVTIDGPRDIHNARRPAAGGLPTFDKILTNIAAIHPGFAISVRVNVDQRNIHTLPRLFDQLDAAGLRGRISLYFAPVAAYTEVCEDIGRHCIEGKHWSSLQTQLHLTALEKGYAAATLPGARTNVCLADRATDLVVVPSGNVFKCWNDVTDPSRAIFDFATMRRNQCMEKVLARWLDWGPFNFPECKTCRILPLCMGGCPHDSLKNERGSCKELKYNLKESILLFYLNHKRQQASKQLMDRIEFWTSKYMPYLI
ncbi:MAG: radical SAM protein, partial [Desulfobacterales bacterium]